MNNFLESNMNASLFLEQQHKKNNNLIETNEDRFQLYSNRPYERAELHFSSNDIKEIYNWVDSNVSGKEWHSPKVFWFLDNSSGIEYEFKSKSDIYNPKTNRTKNRYFTSIL